MDSGAVAESLSARLTRAVALGGAAVAMLAPWLRAQTLRGTIVDRETGAPVVGAIVSLLADSTRLWPVLSDASGAFRVRAELAGTYRVRIDRVGFRPFVQELPVTLALGAVVDRTIRVPASRAELATVQVTTAAACDAPGIRGADAARVWEQLRTALDGARLTARRSLAPLELVLEVAITRGPAGGAAGIRDTRRPTQVWRTRSGRTFVSPE